MSRIAVSSVFAMSIISGSAHAAFFSFASDRDHTSWTFSGLGGVVEDAQDPFDPVILLIDDDNGVLPAIEFNAEFDANISITHAASIPLGGGGMWAHNYMANGSFLFSDSNSDPLLTATFQGALMTSLGTASAWGSTATIQGNDNIASAVEYTWFGPDMPDYGLFTGDLLDPEDFGFDLTVLQTQSGLGVSLDGQFMPNELWSSEASFSGSGSNIPTPMSLMPLAAGSMLILRRRR